MTHNNGDVSNNESLQQTIATGLQTQKEKVEDSDVSIVISNDSEQVEKEQGETEAG